MAEQSAISWTDSTYNPWIGCTRVSPGCDHCYAARDNERRKWVSAWDAERRQTKTARDVLSWERNHAAFFAAHGRNRTVFCASLGDFLDNQVPDPWRQSLFQLWRDTPHLNWIPLTKRIGNAAKMLPPDWPFPNVGIMATMVNQEEYDRDRLKLSAVPAPWRGISAEPLLGRIILDHKDAKANLNWLITGGESGPGFRPLDMDAVRYLRDQCAELGIAFHHKQNGGVRGKDAGCLVDGAEHKFFPPALAA